MNVFIRNAFGFTAFIQNLFRIVIDFCYGSSAYGVTRELMQQRGELEQILLFLVMGDQLGLPVYPSYYSRRLLPLLYPRLSPWRRSLIKPKGTGSW
jgi:hypothetical protein